MKIILDAMGGDNAPEAPVLGAVEAAKTYGIEIVLVGRGEDILAVLKKHGIDNLPEGMEISNADDVVDMHDDPASIIHKRKNSSMVIGLKMLADGLGDAFVSAGSTGALLTGATLLVKRVKGIRRAAMGPAMPNKAGGKTVIVDCGANAECTPEFLLQFGLVGSVYAKKQLGIENPKTWAADWLDFWDMLSEGIMMPLGALLMSLMIGWEIGPEVVKEEAEQQGQKFGSYGFFKVCVKVITPLCMLLILYGQVMSFFG